jgi:LEA14-like dessication related protein
MKKQAKRTIIVSVIIAVIVLFSGVLFALGAFRFDQPVLSVKEMKFVSFDKDRKGYVLDITIGIDNPNLFKLKLSRITGDVYIDEVLVGNIRNDTGLKIPGHGSEDLVLSVHIDDQQMKLYSGEELGLKGKVLGKYLIYEKESSFKENMSLTPDNGGPENLPPISIIDGPHTARVMEDVQFRGSNSYDTDGEIVSYSWDLGDGSTADSQDVTHRYTRIGVYKVELTVFDDQGASTPAFHQIMVTIVR